jgi:phosphoribosyl-ATP pyrophosphohydrolase
MGKSAKQRPGKKAVRKPGKKAVRKPGKKSVLKRKIAAASLDSSAVAASVLDRIWSVVMNRRNANPEVSHSARLLSRGTAKIAQKFGEEAIECLIEATRGDPDALVAESADVLYHLIVMWVDGGIRPEDVWQELHRREGMSGVAEKASRVDSQPRALGARTTKIP